jgi:DNA-binding protein H-NS
MTLEDVIKKYESEIESEKKHQNEIQKNLNNQYVILRTRQDILTQYEIFMEHLIQIKESLKRNGGKKP